jgi:hypothetical protein
LIKDKRGATDDSGNYGGIALSSVLLKVFDWVVFLLFDDQLQNDPNQFGYLTESSANMRQLISLLRKVPLCMLACLTTERLLIFVTM